MDAHTGCTGCGARLYDTLTDGSKIVRGKVVEVNNGEYAGIYCYECIEGKVWRKQ
jgi:predicted nucleic-acid-binding Zn-ribbon protein